MFTKKRLSLFSWLVIFLCACSSNMNNPSDSGKNGAEVPTLGESELSLSKTATGKISASPTTVSVPSSGLGTTTISWSTSRATAAQVYVSVGGGSENLFASGLSSTGTSAPWIQAGLVYTFKLYEGTSKSNLLSSVNVTGVASTPTPTPTPSLSTGSGTIAASPSNVAIKRGSTGTTKISWSTNSVPNAAVYVLMDGATTESIFAQGASSSGTDATWIQIDKSYDFRLYSDTTRSKLLAQVKVSGFEYKVGVDYHSTGTNFDATSFMESYQDPAVRTLVQSQLKSMADRGATIISTRLWLVATEKSSSGVMNEKWKWHFPPAPFELANLTQYAQDVASTVAADGHLLELDLTLLRLWAADISYGSLSTTLGRENLTVTEFSDRWKATYTSVVDAVAAVKRPDGKSVISTIYMDGEVMIGAKANQDWFLKTFYPGFVTYASSKGLNPSLYYLVDTTESNILDESFVDSTYPVLTKHRSMYWVYRSLRFMKDNLLPMPTRIDWSNYIKPVNSTYDILTQRVFDDADATLPSLGLAKQYANAEMNYPLDDVSRKALGAAMAKQRLVNGRLRQSTFWTTPDGGGTGVNVAFPFAFEDFLP